MATRLMIMRHATTGWATLGQSDHDRILTGHGRDETPRMAKTLQDLGWKPDICLVSSSMRTRETFSLLQFSPHVIKEEIYRASLETLMSVVEDIEDEKTTLVLGHNPSCEMLVATLCGAFHPMPPATCVLFIKDGESWQLEKVLRTSELN